MSTEMYVYLGIKKFKSDPDQITKIVGVKPTEVKRKGDPIGSSTAKCKFNSWKLRIDVTSKFDLEIGVKAILSKFKDKKQLLKAIGMGEGSIVCVLHTSGAEPTIELSPETIGKLSELNLGFWLDLYPWISKS